MFSSILLGALIACNQPAPTAEYVPGVIETDGKLIATVNGVQIKDGIVDSLLKDVPEAQRAMIMAVSTICPVKGAIGHHRSSLSRSRQSQHSQRR